MPMILATLANEVRNLSKTFLAPQKFALKEGMLELKISWLKLDDEETKDWIMKTFVENLRQYLDFITSNQGHFEPPNNYQRYIVY